MRALPKNVTSVYLLNQDYLFLARPCEQETKEQLQALRPDIDKVAGEEFIPIGKVKDFSPYISKIKNSGAQVLIIPGTGAPTST